MDDYGMYYYGAPKFACGRNVCTVLPGGPLSARGCLPPGAPWARPPVLPLPAAARPPLPPPPGAAVAVCPPAYAPVPPPYATPYATVVPAGWVEVGYLVSVTRDDAYACGGGGGACGGGGAWGYDSESDSDDGDYYPDERHGDHRRPCGGARRRRCATRRRNPVVRESTAGPARYRPCADHHADRHPRGCRCHECSESHHSPHRRRPHRRRPCPPPPPAVRCVVRRYRLFARAANPCRSFGSAHYYQYAVSEEGVPGAILVRLSDDPRVGSSCATAAPLFGGGSSCQRYTELCSGELVRVPGEPCAFRVQLYADDARYA